MPQAPDMPAPPTSTTDTPASRARRACAALPTTDRDLRTATVNLCLLRQLERIAAAFEIAGLPLMALKGAALHLTLFDHPAQRPMSDLDLLIRQQDADAAIILLEKLGYRPGRPLVHAGFFPRFHYETELVRRRSIPVRIDLHVRPFRPLRYGRVVPESSLWDGAQPVPIGRATVLVPSRENMLIHLAVHSAIHGNGRELWLDDIRRWIEAHRHLLDWQNLCQQAREWRVTLPLRNALHAAGVLTGDHIPPEAIDRLVSARIGWRDRLALRQAPRDADHPAAHVIVDALCTPGMWYVARYLLATLVPDRRHMAEWYDGRHAGWLATAHVLRLLGPLLRRFPRLWTRMFKTELRDRSDGAPGVFASTMIAAGERIATFAPAGKLACLRHSCRPNTRRSGRNLIALRVIDNREELTLDYGPQACDCRRSASEDCRLNDDTHANHDAPQETP